MCNSDGIKWIKVHWTRKFENTVQKIIVLLFVKMSTPDSDQIKISILGRFDENLSYGSL